MNYSQRAVRFFIFFLLLFAAAVALPYNITAGFAAFAAEQTRSATADTLGAERILLFDSQAEIAANGEMTVTETIRFLVRGESIKRGIIRDLPLAWKREDGKRFRLDVKVLSVQRNGDPESYSTATSNNFLAVRIGDSRRIVPQGIQEYRITYTVSNHFSRFDDWDELYWNVTGNGWEFPMDSVRFSLRFAPELADVVTAAAAGPGKPPRAYPVPWESIDVYTGLVGEKGGKATVRPDGSVASTEPLRENEGLTVAYTWPRAILSKVSAPKEDNPLRRLLLPDIADPFSFVYWLIPLLLVLYYLRTWKKLRPVEAQTTVIPLFAPPDNISPGRLRYVLFHRYDSTAFASDLLHIIAKGGMRLAKPDAEEKKRSLLSRLSTLEPLLVCRTPGNHLTREETHTLKTLFGSESTLDLAPARQESVQKAFAYRERKALEAGETLFHPVQREWGKGFLFFLFFPVALLVFFPFGSFFFSILSIAFFSIFFSILFFFTLAYVGSFRDISSMRQILPKLFALAALSPFWFAFGTLCYHLFPLFGMHGMQLLPDGFAGAATVSLLIIAVARFTAPERTKEGAELQAVANGLKMYLGTAERRRFEYLYPPVESVEHFEQLLPYALALGVGKTWANRFGEYLERSGEVAEQFSEMHSWSSLRSFSGISAAAAAATPVRSSGSSGGGSSFGSGSRGGGSSGGGSGGGGGRGW